MSIRRYYTQLLVRGRNDNPSLIEAARDLDDALSHTRIVDLNG